MEIAFRCSECLSKVAADADLCGEQSQCPGCGSPILIPSPSFEAGRELGGYRIEQLLGEGAMGEVYLAKQLSMDRDVALKILRPALIEDEEYLARFQNEVRLLGRMSHPNMITAFEAGDVDGHHFVAMLYVEGKDVESVIRDQGAIPEGDAVAMGFHVAKALDYAWTDFQVLHRDVKPSNIMIGDSGAVYLMDMGISKRVGDESDLTMAGFIVGTPYYMSPEQAKGQVNLDCRSDIYSLGATLYHAISGRTPFDGETTLNILTQLVTDPPPPIREVNSDVSEQGARVLDKMMAKDRDNRYQSWEETSRALHSVSAAVEAEASGTRVPVAAPLAFGKAAGSSSQHADSSQRRRKFTLNRTRNNSGSKVPAPRKSVWRSPMFLSSIAALALIAGYVIYVATADSSSRDGAIAVPTSDSGQQTANAGELFEQAEDYISRNPDKYADAIAKLDQIIDLGAGTEFESAARKRRRQVQQAKESAARQLEQQLQQQVNNLLAQERFDDARSLTTLHSGPLENATRAFRRKLQDDIDRAERAQQEQRRGQTRKAQQELQRQIRQIAGAIMRDRLDQAVSTLAESAGKLSPVHFQQLNEELQSLTETPELILASFNADRGKLVKIRLQQGKSIRLKIQGVSGQTIRASKRVAFGELAGEVKYDLTIADLASTEKRERLARMPAATPLMHGVLALQTGRPELARNCFEQSGARLAPALLGLLE